MSCPGTAAAPGTVGSSGSGGVQALPPATPQCTPSTSINTGELITHFRVQLGQVIASAIWPLL